MFHGKNLVQPRRFDSQLSIRASASSITASPLQKAKRA
jgi:hypothetical protein